MLFTQNANGRLSSPAANGGGSFPEAPPAPPSSCAPRNSGPTSSGPVPGRRPRRRPVCPWAAAEGWDRATRTCTGRRRAGPTGRWWSAPPWLQICPGPGRGPSRGRRPNACASCGAGRGKKPSGSSGQVWSAGPWSPVDSTRRCQLLWSPPSGGRTALLLVTDPSRVAAVREAPTGFPVLGFVQLWFPSSSEPTTDRFTIWYYESSK